MDNHLHEWTSACRLQEYDIQDCACGARRKVAFSAFTEFDPGQLVVPDPRGSLFNTIPELEAQLERHSTCAGLGA